MSKKRIVKFISLSIAVIFIGIIIWLCYCLSLAFQDNYADKYTLAQTDDTLASTAIKAAILGSDFQITDTQFNTYLNEILCSDGNNKGDNAIEKIAFYFHDDDKCEIYAKIHIYGYSFGFYSKAAAKFDSSKNMIYFTLYDAKLGNLNLPDNLLSYGISKSFENIKDIYVEETTISIKSIYEYKIKDSSIQIYLNKMTTHEGYVECRTNSLAKEAIKLFLDYISSLDINEVKDGLFSLFQ